MQKSATQSACEGPAPVACGPCTCRLSAGLCALLCAAYAVGLCREISEPWVGLHDWNGAFYSQLARNFARYPWSAHHGMPLVAVGDDAPPEERCLYATHPAGLVWLLAAGRWILGDGEAAMRLAAIIASLLTLAVWTTMVARREGRLTALLTGLFYSVMPMAVFFGRMVNHEAFCLLFMALAVACWPRIARRDSGRAWRCRIGWTLATWMCMWIDWVGVLFAGVFALYAILQWRRGLITRGVAAAVAAAVIIGATGIVLHVVYGGLEGNWSNLRAVFFSRAGAHAEPDAGDIIVENATTSFTLPLLLLGLAGWITGRRLRAPRAPLEAPRAGGDARIVLLLTAAGWLVLFPRQFVIHQYWAFYLCPHVALFAARAVVTCRGLCARFGPIVANGVVAVPILIVLYSAQRETDRLFGHVLCRPEYVATWKELRATYPAGRRVPLPWNPVLMERFGTYEFRNITPPQMAYYLDRPFLHVPSP